ncbi:hypothetical protein [Nocardioides sp.]|uniref:hypothetical protein n=1 Tax=Nocardioides sp. TaxID=35761 RepID=UPI001A2B9CF3|nr:hypothetical protein [Nocardioides sp.]MBJ7355818.1 hypothetical protein [Nocardioides sp.]
MTAAPTRTAISAVDPRSVAHLTVSRGYPCISVLLPTTPSRRMLDADAGLLSRLLHQVKQQLEDSQVTSRDKLLSELEGLALVARESRTDSGLGLFVNLSLTRAWTLPVPVNAKAVVESTFATRDLLRALHRTPPHLVLRLDGFGARAFWVSDRVTVLDAVERIPRSGGGSGVAARREAVAEERRDFVARVDARLTRLRSEHTAPLVLAGDLDLVTELKGRARSLQRLAGEVVGAEAAEPATLFPAAALRLEDYLHRRGQQTLDALREAAADTPGRVIAGLDDCEAAIAGYTPGTLVVEHGYVHPRAETGTAPASHDLIDDLLELALENGNLIAFVEDGQLHEFGGIAVLRP